ncbi:hypothetical protein CHLRE_12g543302v5 [Chlamydomonas reinhardtii]|uniref:Serine-threonine/tyrosine-protein kinase catalytic domain-containing protein n=1 Tax=Chlamydomonas reinhardtii TaxID=3055 RepID=A0A2K3D6R5_CHLRE|nr:uncharacterized protein CHLRE_12g543302v5 [Chlamydomonas reinhardtii]PNW76220.1 hypothetical protein CHLRE_12g543302v5 [Chlamydomonas reinhardtii]
MSSFAVALWVMLTGQQPWKDWSMVAITYNITRGARLPLDGVDLQRCPPKLKRLITACWEADPLRQPAAAEALKELLLVHEQVAMGARGAAVSCLGVASAPLLAPVSASSAAPAIVAAAEAEAANPVGLIETTIYLEMPGFAPSATKE